MSDQKRVVHEATLTLHAGAAQRDVGEPASTPPVLATSFFTHPDAVGFSANDLKEAAPHFYTRWSNPTLELLETRLAALEGGEAALSFASGMAAISALFLDRLGSGDHLVLSNDLVRACGAHVWQEMRPPTPDAVASVFAEAKTGRDRLVRLVEELDAFYARGAHRLALAARDRELVPELDGFLTAVEAGVEALVREALAHTGDGAHVIQVAVAFTSFQFWTQFTRIDLAPAELTRLKVKILEYALKAARQV